MNTKAPAVARLIEWLSSPLVEFFTRALALGCFLLGLIALVLGFASSSSTTVHLSMPVLIPLSLYATVAIHEGGHVIGARLCGMLVLAARIGPIEVHPRRGMWKLRLCRPTLRPDAGGCVLMVPDFSRPLGPQRAIAFGGGPLANLIAAGVSAVVATRVQPWLAGAWGGFATFNALMGIANLIPCVRRGSDGFLLLTLLYPVRPDDPAYAYLRLIWRSYRGTPAERLPPEDLEVLERQGAPMTLVRLWFALKAAQNTGAWPQALAAADAAEAEAAKLDGTMLRPLLGLLDSLRLERAFADAMLTRRPLNFSHDRFRRIRYWSPQLEARCKALDGALAADRAVTEKWLGVCWRATERMPDLALHESERSLSDAIRALLAA